MGIRPYLPIPKKSLFRSAQQPGPYDHLFDVFGNPVEGLVSRLPKHYLDQIKPKPPPNRNWQVPKYPYHIVPKGANKPHIEKRFEQAMWAPIPVLYPKRSRQELWSGEGIIFGYRQRDRYDRPHRTLWHPKLEHCTLYSEILDQEFTTIVSDTTLDLIDEYYGFDFYILKMPPHELLSDFGMKLKGQMLRSLASKSYWRDDSEMHEMISEKYKDHFIPFEEASWVGLSPEEAVFRLQLAQGHDYRPLKEIYADEENNASVGGKNLSDSFANEGSKISNTGWMSSIKNLFSKRN